MKHRINIIRISLFLFCLTGFNNAYADYTKTIVAGTSFAIPTTNWAAADDDKKNVNIGFSFPFGNTNSTTQVTINSNGALTLSGVWTAYENQALPSNSKPTIIAPYWDDLNPSNSGTISYGTFGSPGSYRFVASWNNVPHYPSTGSYTFQVVLYENGDIRYRYSNSCTSCTGSSATIGVQESGSVYNQHIFNQATLDRTKDILYTRVLPPLHPAVSPTCASPSPQLALSTYNKSGYNHPPSLIAW